MQLAYSTAVDDLGSVVARAAGGDRKAFAELYRRFHRAVHGVVLAKVSFGDAADLGSVRTLMPGRRAASTIEASHQHPHPNPKGGAP